MVVEQPVAAALVLVEVAVLSPYFQMSAGHVHLFASLALAPAEVAGNK